MFWTAEQIPNEAYFGHSQSADPQVGSTRSIIWLSSYDDETIALVSRFLSPSPGDSLLVNDRMEDDQSTFVIEG
jgi:hypothetical protein